MIFLKDRLDMSAELLSHGQKQWLEIGMLLIQDPELLMLDEPVAGMSVSERVKTAELLNRIIKDRSVIVIEHDMKFVEDIAHKVTVLHQGKILSEGSMEQVQERSQGHRSLSRPLSEHRQGAPACWLSPDLHVAYGQSEVLHGLNVSVAPNEIVAIMGRNGMGKTTLMKSLMGILPTKSGSVTMDGAELSTLQSYERVAKGLAYVPQGRMIFSDHDGEGEHRDRPRRLGRARGARRHLRAVSGAAGDEGPPRRQSLRRPAAAARDRARAGHQAQGAAARRADRGHPAVDHQGHGAHA